MTLTLLMLSGGGIHAQYYANPQNYIKVDAVVTFLSQREDGSIALFVKTDSRAFSGTLKIIPENAILASANGLLNEVEVGDEVSLLSAPAYFADGYIVPVVGIAKDDKEYIDFSTGISNQVTYQWEVFAQVLGILVIPVAITIFCWATLLLQIKKDKQQTMPSVHDQVRPLPNSHQLFSLKAMNILHIPTTC